MQLQRDTLWRRSDNVLVREVDGELILLDLDTEMYFGLNEGGTEVWQLLTAQPATIADLTSRLMAEFDVEAAVLIQDLERLLEALSVAGLICETEPGQ